MFGKNRDHNQPQQYGQAPAQGVENGSHPQGHPQGQPQYIYVQPKKKNWFLRHKFLTALLALVVFGGIMTAINGGGSDDSNKTNNAAQKSDQASGGDSKSGDKAADGPAKVGTPVRDGKFEFTVTKVETGKKQVGQQYMEEKAQGEFTLVYVTVKNIGDQQQGLSDSDQKAMDADGTQYSADSTAGMSMPGNEVLFNQINPGNQVKGVLVFDAPAGKKLTEVELHDSMFSDGVKASLK